MAGGRQDQELDRELDGVGCVCCPQRSRLLCCVWLPLQPLRASLQVFVEQATQELAQVGPLHRWSVAWQKDRGRLTPNLRFCPRFVGQAITDAELGEGAKY